MQSIEGHQYLPEEQAMDEKVVEQVRIHYAEAATAVLTRGEATSGSADAGCCGTDSACCSGAATLPAGEGAAFYGPDDAAQVPQAAMLASLGCGNPLVVADLLPGERVLDLGSVSYTHLRAHETGRNLVCRLLLEKKKNNIIYKKITKIT